MTTQTWSPQQLTALDKVGDWMRSGSKPFFYLAGYAGTGKTTLAKHFATGIDGHVAYGSFTGKAASVMRDKGCHDATTIHRLIYAPNSKGTAKLRELQQELQEASTDLERATVRLRIQAEIEHLKAPNFRLNEEADVRNASLIIIDECSMVNGRMADDLLSFKVPVLVLGDPAQLPPVGGEGFFTAGEPDFMLTEVHRQARESGILRLATDIREGKQIDFCDLGDAVVMSKGELNPEDVPGYDQVIVGRNKTRHATNVRVRELLGRTSDMPQTGDRLVCLRNNHELGLLNGEIYTAGGDARLFGDETLQLFIEDGSAPQSIEAWQAPFRGDKLERWDSSGDTQEFTFGYVLTCHKSQGSAFPRVIVFDESRFFRADAQRWLYTAVTRASEQLTLIR